MKHHVCLGLVLALAVSGCGSATFPADRLPESVMELCQKENNLYVNSKLIGNTLWTYVPIEGGLLDDQMHITEHAADAIENAVLNVHRVTMSTDAPLEFYVIVIADISHLGAELTLIGHTRDVRRARLLDISRDEYQKRMIRELKLNPRALGDREGSYLLLSDINMPRFLAEQAVRRIRMLFRDDETLQNSYEVQTADWRLGDGPSFHFVLDIAPRVEETTWKEPLQKATDGVLRVFRGYGVKQFEQITISDLHSGKAIQLTSPDQMDRLYRHKIELDQLLLPFPINQ